MMELLGAGYPRNLVKAFERVCIGLTRCQMCRQAAWPGRF